MIKYFIIQCRNNRYNFATETSVCFIQRWIWEEANEEFAFVSRISLFVEEPQIFSLSV